jgi:hypothetical protein
MITILWIIAAVVLAFLIVGWVLALLGFFVHIIFFILHYALIAIVAIVIFNLIAGRMKRS